MVEDEELLLAVLNSTPVLDGVRADRMQGVEAARLVSHFGGTGTPAELHLLRRARQALQDVVHGRGGALDALQEVVEEVSLAPQVGERGLGWALDPDRDSTLAARAVLAWSEAVRAHPGRLRACANTECALFLLDHSRPGTAKWCSMAACGNRMKARAHAGRRRGRAASTVPGSGAGSVIL